ncbi:MAG: SCO family protein [Candidatus Thalassarchaeaceae archaeon]|jgi:cytochrome oxidase Cu insertion factor (SCO1/SenC/PrrC family)|nr:SCO family protein [Candidatus Thalassarchaeaceae archaeon]
MRPTFSAPVLALVILCAGCTDSGTEILGTEYNDPPRAPDFTLKNQWGEDVSLSDFADKVVVVAFIYTSCPDVCLIISSNLDYVKQNLGAHSDMVEIVSITIDPARDTSSHLRDWTEERGYDWNHLTHERGSVIQAVWDDWNVVVDAQHISTSLPPEEATIRFSVLFPDNSSIVTDNPCHDSPNLTCYEDGGEFADNALRVNAGLQYDIANGTIGNWTTDASWTWNLHSWNNENETWERASSNEPSTIQVGVTTHLAWIASNANISFLPSGVDCNGHGWVMGSDGSAHCMCDEGWERLDDDWLSCVAEGSSDHSESHTDPHDKSLGEYEVGHSTVTFIIDKSQRKRIAYSGINWAVDDFLQDVKTLADE